MTIDRNSGIRIVSIGGGTGLSTLLSGLKMYVGPDSCGLGRSDPFWIERLTAVVTVTDDGGSSGRLREQFQVLPPGDVRNCMVALAEDEHLLTKLLQYRFESDGDLSGHSFGNILLTALTRVTGDFLAAIKLTSDVLNIKGRIFPSTVEDVTLIAEMADGREVCGETNIVASRSQINHIRLSKEHCSPLPETLVAIAEADLITLGPGSLYTSIIPNLLVKGVIEALRDSRASKIYICNVMTQPGETDGYTADDHYDALNRYARGLGIDYMIANSAPISAHLRHKYLSEGATQVEINSNTSLGDCCLVLAPLVSEDDHVRHDPKKLADLLIDIYQSQHLARAHQ